MKKYTSLLILCGFLFSPSFYAKDVKIAFFFEHFNVRGSDVASYDYADCNETILGNISYIFFVKSTNFYSSQPASDFDYSSEIKFRNRFRERFYQRESFAEIEQLVATLGIDIMYFHASGQPPGIVSSICKNAIHAVFPPLEPYGDAYVAISAWLSNEYKDFNVPVVPLMVRVDETKDDLRTQLKIPSNAVVFGRHGGFATFDIQFVRDTVVKMAEQHRDWYFLFLNTERFCDLPNVIFLPASSDLVHKTKFINTCDAMLHAREQGETFGLACAEFSVCNKPVITYSGSSEKCHCAILGSKGFYYDNQDKLESQCNLIANHIATVRCGLWDAYSRDYNPHTVMLQFEKEFIIPLTRAMS